MQIFVRKFPAIIKMEFDSPGKITQQVFSCSLVRRFGVELSQAINGIGDVGSGTYCELVTQPITLCAFRVALESGLMRVQA